jgi:hypothetical protein
MPIEARIVSDNSACAKCPMLLSNYQKLTMRVYEPCKSVNSNMSELGLQHRNSAASNKRAAAEQAQGQIPEEGSRPNKMCPAGTDDSPDHGPRQSAPRAVARDQQSPDTQLHNNVWKADMVKEGGDGWTFRGDVLQRFNAENSSEKTKMEAKKIHWLSKPLAKSIGSLAIYLSGVESARKLLDDNVAIFGGCSAYVQNFVRHARLERCYNCN